MEDEIRRIMDDSTDYQTVEVDAEIAISKLLVLFPVIKCDCEDNNYALVEITENLCLECHKPIK